MDRQLVEIYRTADDYLRYTTENASRGLALGTLYRKYQRYFGRSVLDLAAEGASSRRSWNPPADPISESMRTLT